MLLGILNTLSTLSRGPAWIADDLRQPCHGPSGKNLAEIHLNHYELDARAQITDVIFRYCRGLDRMDKNLTLSCWHPRGTDDHGKLYSGSAEGFVEWIWPIHAAMVATRHMVVNIQIAVHDGWAGSESYAWLILRIPQGDKVYECNFYSRYLDRFELIDGLWKIRHRTQVRDFARYELVGSNAEPPPGPPLIEPTNPYGINAVSSRDADDPSFEIVYGKKATWKVDW